MPERSNGAVSKTVVLGDRDRGFESLSLRHQSPFKGFFTNQAMGQLVLNADVVEKFLKFGLVGISGVFVDFGITFLLRNKLKVHQYLANATGFLTAASTNYIFNRIYTFHSQNPHMLWEYGKFIGVSLVGLGINTLVLWLLVSKAQWNFYFAKVFAIGAATFWNFFINLAITFV